MKPKIEIAIADDELLFRQGIKNMLEADTEITVLFDAENGQDLVQKLRSSKIRPSIVITDLKMPELNGVEVTKIIRKEFPRIKIIALTSYFSKPFILNMVSIGAVAYLAKNSTPSLMIKTIKEVHKNGFYYTDEVQRYIENSNLNTQSAKTKSHLDNEYFTERELEVLKLICMQLTANEIAEKLFISNRTVETHRKNLFVKTETKNIAGLVVYALKNKLVELDVEL
ncbi:response regulator [Winogradskyella litorisediminis]|uniref:Response regulator n=1 Tax=Winogradskyella litorisediminis TaxID=1156618 RepID=A0ABW3N408_9FLAO